MVSVQILGTAQDAGIPQIGCSCEVCVDAINNSKNRRRVASISVSLENKTFLIDASPDMPHQIRSIELKSSNKLGIDGIILTHLHYGHYIGLAQLGREVASTDHLPVYMSEPVLEFIKTNKPFSYLIKRSQIKPKIFSTNELITTDGLKIKPVEVPHRNEDGDTHGFIIYGENESLLYIPDIDYLTDDVVTLFDTVDIVLFDGTFYSDDELPFQEDVPHPPIKDTIRQLGKTSNFYFTHFNHTNPILYNSDIVKELELQGYKLARDNMMISLE